MGGRNRKMMRIKGIGDRKYEEYGEVFINVIKTHLDERNNKLSNK